MTNVGGNDMALNESLYASGNGDWETPDSLFAQLNKEFRFTLDSCASQENAKCKRFFTEDDNALAQRWKGRVFCNPPYGRGIGAWVEKAYRESQENSEVVVCLLPVRSDTKWWHKWVMQSSEIRLLTRRLTFKGSGNKAPVPSAIVVFRGKADWGPKLIPYEVLI
jgi:phage N-6-adenine-methyltransferase